MVTRTLPKLGLLALLALGMAGCGYTPGQRAFSGAGIGAAGGAVLGAATGGNPLTGALIGGAGGALLGGLTSPRTLDLGPPL